MNMKRRTIIYFDPEAIKTINELRGITPISIFVNHQIKQLGIKLEPQPTASASHATPKFAPEKKPIPPKKTRYIKCKKCGKLNVDVSDTVKFKECSGCGFRIRREDFEYILQ